MTLDEVLTSLQDINLSKPEEEMVVITDEPKIPGYLCFPNEETAKRFDTKDVFGQGFDTDKTKARIKSIAEFLERLCLFNPDAKKFLTLRHEPNDKFIDPGLFCCYSDEQLADRGLFIKESRKAQYRWWRVRELISGEEKFIPAQLVFLSHTFDDEFPVRKERISTGSALGPVNTNHALLSGFMESIERDACISSYLTKRKIKRISNLPDEINSLVDYLTRYQLFSHVFDVTTDLNVPSVIVITLDYTGIGAAVNVGSRSDINYEDAIKHAILESIHCRRVSRVMRAFQFPENLPNEDEITSLDNRFYYWYALERIQDLDFWLENQKTVSYSELTRRNITFDKAVETLSLKGYHIFIADMTLPEIKEGGFEALKIIIPELHPLYLDERAKALYSVHQGIIKDDKTLRPHPLT